MRAAPLALALSVVLASCGGSGGGDATGLDFLVVGDPVEIAAVRDVVAAYERREPELDIRLIEGNDREDLLTRLSTFLAGGSRADLFLVDHRFYGRIAAEGVLEPIEGRVATSKTLDAEDFYPQALDAFRREGTLMCLPQSISTVVVYFNRDVFESLGIPEPKAGWTWTDMRQAAIGLTRDSDGDGTKELYGLGVEPSIIGIAPFVWSNGGELVDDDEDPARLTLDSPAALTALRNFLALRTEFRVVPSDEELEAEDDESRFMDGRLAMILRSRVSTPAFRTIEKFDWDIAPLPRFQQPAGILQSDAYCMSKASKQKEAAWRFMEFALGPDGQRIAARTGRTVPSLKEVASSEAFLDPAQRPRSSRVFLDGIRNIRRIPAISTWPEIDEAAGEILRDGVNRGLSAESVARELDEATRPLFARSRS